MLSRWILFTWILLGLYHPKLLNWDLIIHIPISSQLREWIWNSYMKLIYRFSTFSVLLQNSLFMPLLAIIHIRCDICVLTVIYLLSAMLIVSLVYLHDVLHKVLFSLFFTNKSCLLDIYGEATPITDSHGDKIILCICMDVLIYETWVSPLIIVAELECFIWRQNMD